MWSTTQLTSASQTISPLCQTLIYVIQEDMANVFKGSQLANLEEYSSYATAMNFIELNQLV